MHIPPSDLFTPVSLAASYNASQSDLSGALESGDIDRDGSLRCFRGVPFDLGPADGANVILLDSDPVSVDLGGATASFVVFLHVVEDREQTYLGETGDSWGTGQLHGDAVSEYVLDYADGSSETHPIDRRFAIQQRRVSWGSSAFAAMPEKWPAVRRASDEDRLLGLVSDVGWGSGESRNAAGRDQGSPRWLYAVPNPNPDKPLKSVTLVPKQERSVVYGVTLTTVTEHPLRPQMRRKLLVQLPAGVELNAIGELDDIALDLGVVISARQQFGYDPDAWSSDTPQISPSMSKDVVVVEFMAHPQAKLYVGTGDGGSDVHPLESLGNGVSEILPAHRPVTIRVIDTHSRRPVGVRLHLHGEAGEYLPPRGYHRSVNPRWFQDNYAEFVHDNQQYAYIGGECIVDLPLGTVYVELERGYEITPVRQRVEIGPDTDVLEFELERVLDWRGSGWVTADTHVHFLSPSTAQLEGEAEDVNVVNLLASQWGEMFSNVGDFDGRTTHGAVESGGDGEFLVRVGSENRMQVLGHISLLGYSGQLIHPLCTGGPSEAAIGDPQEVSMAEWAQRCRDQNGLVVMPHAPNPQCERAADFILDVIDANEMMKDNPYRTGISSAGLADWYKYLNLGCKLPVVGGSDKMAACMLLGGCRTYVHLGDREFTYENWMAAIRAGNTFVTIGPLLDLQVEGQHPGSAVALADSGGTVSVSWRVESVRVPVFSVELIVGGLVVEESTYDGVLEASGSASVQVESSSWIALRVRGSYGGRQEDIAAHTSAVQVLTGDKEIFSPADAHVVLNQIEGALAYVDTIATRPEAERFRQMRASIEAAHNRLHQRMHRHGLFHSHSPMHDHHDE